MPKYKITVEELLEKPGEKYPDKTTIYEQTVEDLDLKDVIVSVNKMPRIQNIDMSAKERTTLEPLFPRRVKGTRS